MVALVDRSTVLLDATAVVNPHSPLQIAQHLGVVVNPHSWPSVSFYNRQIFDSSLVRTGTGAPSARAGGTIQADTAAVSILRHGRAITSAMPSTRSAGKGRWLRHACGNVMVGYTALCALQGITLQKLEITSEGDIDLRGFFGLDPSVAPGYRELRTRVVIKGDGTEEQLQKIHELVLATSPNFYNITRAVAVVPALIIE